MRFRKAMASYARSGLPYQAVDFLLFYFLAHRAFGVPLGRVVLVYVAYLLVVGGTDLWVEFRETAPIPVLARSRLRFFRLIVYLVGLNTALFATIPGNLRKFAIIVSILYSAVLYFVYGRRLKTGLKSP